MKDKSANMLFTNRTSDEKVQSYTIKIKDVSYSQ